MLTVYNKHEQISSPLHMVLTEMFITSEAKDYEQGGLCQVSS